MKIIINNSWAFIKNMKQKIRRSFLNFFVLMFVFVLIAGLFLIKFSQKVLAASTINITTVELTMTNDADSNHYANIGDTITVSVSLDNTYDNPTACNTTTTVVTVDLQAYGLTAAEALPCVSADGIDGLDFENTFVIQNAPVLGIQVAPNNAASAVTVTAEDTNTPPSISTAPSNNLGDGVIDTATTAGVDTVAPTITNAHIESNNTISPLFAKAGDTVTLSFDASETLSVPPTVTFSSGGVAVNNGGNPIAVVNTSGNSWTASYVVVPTDTEGPVTFSINGFKDIANNTGITKTTVDDGSTTTIDLMPPPLVRITAKTQAGNFPDSDSVLWYNYPGNTFEAYVESNENLYEAKVCIMSLTGVDPTHVCTEGEFAVEANYLSSGIELDASSYTFTGQSIETLAGHSLTDMAGYSLNIELIDNAGNVNVVSNPAQAFVMVWNLNPLTMPGTVLGGTTTDWSKIDDFTYVSGLTFQAVSGLTVLGDLSFPGYVDLTSPDTVLALTNFSENVLVGGGDVADGSADIGLNAGALAALNQPADLTIYVPGATSQPGVVVYDDAGLVCGYVANYAADATVCGDDLSSIAWNAEPQTLTFSTSGFSKFGADGVAPTVVTYSPANGATNVAIDSSLVLTFSENLRSPAPARVIARNVTIYKTSDDSVVEVIPSTSDQITFDGTTGITIKPSANLAKGTSYYVKIDSGAFTDLVGNPYAGISDKNTWSFTTVKAASGGSGSMASTPPTKTEIPGCGTRTEGYSVLSGASCAANIPHNEQGTSDGQNTNAPKFQFTLLLKLGSSGNEVMELQKLLNGAPYNSGLVVDGKFGPKTKAALIKFQLANGLVGDGIVGPMTRAVLNK